MGAGPVAGYGERPSARSPETRKAEENDGSRARTTLRAIHAAEWMLLRSAHAAETRQATEAAAIGLQSEHDARRAIRLARTGEAIAALPSSLTAAERRAAIDRLRREEAAELAAMDAAHRQSVGHARRGGRERVRDAQKMRSRALTSRQRHERMHLAILLKSIGAVRRARRRSPPFQSIPARVLVSPFVNAK